MKKTYNSKPDPNSFSKRKVSRTCFLIMLLLIVIAVALILYHPVELGKYLYYKYFSEPYASIVYKDEKEKDKTANFLVLALESDVIETTNVMGGAYFDHDGNGFAEQTGWITSKEGALVMDRNGDGIIKEGGELFGNYTALKNGRKASDGFEALAEWDENKDGKIDIHDSIWKKLRVWQDIDGDGYSASDELFTLGELGIKSIVLHYTDTNITDPNGNIQKRRGIFEKADGRIGVTASIIIKRDVTYTIANEWLDVPKDVASLPDLQGYGNVYDLHQAVVRDKSGRLKELVKQFMSAENPNNRDIIMELMIFKWTGSDNVSPNSRGKFIDARKLVAVEKLIGKRFIGTEGPNPHEAAAPILEKTYRGIFEMYYAQMIAQTHLKDLYGKITYTWDQEKNRIKGDLSQVASEIQQRISSNPENGKIILNEFIRTLWGFQATDMMNYETFRNSFVSNKPEIALIFRKYEEKGEKITVLRSQKIRRR